MWRDPGQTKNMCEKTCENICEYEKCVLCSREESTFLCLFCCCFVCLLNEEILPPILPGQHRIEDGQKQQIMNLVR